MAAVARRDRAGPVHRAVRRAAGRRDRPRAAADDVDLRVGHPHRRLRRARRDLRDLRERPALDEAIAGGEQAVADAERDARRSSPSTDAATWHDADDARRVRRHARLRGRRAADARVLPRDGPAPGASGTTRSRPTPTTPWAAARDGVRGARRRAPRDATRATSTIPAYNLDRGRARRASAPTATSRWRGSPACCSCSPLAWVVIGMLAARTRLVRRPGAAAARASWLAATRPWRARESTLGHAAAGPMAAARSCPAALLVATRAVQTSFLAPVHLARDVSARGWSSRSCVRLLVWRPLAVAGHRGRRRGGGAALHRDAGRAVVHRPRRLLVRVLDRARRGAPSTSRSRSRCSSGCSSRRAGRSPPRSVRAAPPARCSPRSARASPCPPRSSARSGSRPALTRLERPDRAAAVGARAHPRHHGLPRHPRRHRVVGGGFGAVLAVVGVLLALPRRRSAEA